MNKTYDLETAINLLKKQNENNHEKAQKKKISNMDYQSYNQHLRNLILEK